MWKFEMASSYRTEIITHQICYIWCVRKTPFRKSGHIFIIVRIRPLFTNPVTYSQQCITEDPVQLLKAIDVCLSSEVLCEIIRFWLISTTIPGYGLKLEPHQMIRYASVLPLGTMGYRVPKVIMPLNISDILLACNYMNVVT